MSYEEMREGFENVAFTTTVPFGSDGRINHDAMAENQSQLYDAGARLFVPCGNTGEYYALGHDERIETVQTHVEAVSDDAVVVGGVAGSLLTVEQLVRSYEDAGADAVMVMHPDHTYLHEDGLIEYYHAICDMTDLGVVIYKRGPEVTRDAIAAISTHDNVVAVKFAVNDIKEFSQSVCDVPGELTWVNGIAERYALSFAAEGAKGYTTGIGNFVPEVTLALFDAIQNEEWERAVAIRELLRPLEDLREENGDNPISAANNVPAVKYGMDLAGYHGGPVRPPLVELTDEDKARTEAFYETIKETNLDLRQVA